MRKIKSEYRLRDRMSTDVIVDSEAVKTAYDSMYPATKIGVISGYVQEINYNPFGILLICLYQVIIFSKIRVKILELKRYYLYSLFI